MTELKFIEENTIAILTLNVYTFTIPLVREIHEALDKLEATTGPLCLITTSSNKKIYSAGLNFKVFDQHYEDIHNLLSEFCRLLARIMELPFPTIAAINGHCLAGGMMFAMSHDVRVMNGDQGKMGMTEINLGMTIPLNMIAPLQAKLGPKALREINLFGESLDANQALQLEVIDKVVKGDKLMSESLEYAKRLAVLACHREAYQGIKVSLYRRWIQQAEALPRDIYARTIIRRRQANL
jgi:enoyl-CoA hydratase/carnithine racemase